MSKVKLRIIDSERWRYILYATPDDKWIASFSYSPQSFVDASMLIELTQDEQVNTKSDRQFLSDMADNVRNRYLDYVDRALNVDDFKIIE